MHLSDNIRSSTIIFVAVSTGPRSNDLSTIKTTHFLSTMIAHNLHFLFVLSYCFIRVLSNHNRPIERRRITRFQRNSKHESDLADLWLQKHYDSTKIDSVRLPCPCSNPRYCEPIVSNFPVRKSGEVYGFVGPNEKGQQFNWTHISTVAWADEDELMCQAHQHGARAVLASPGFNLTLLATLSGSQRNQYIHEWVQKTFVMVKARYRDGIVFDYEEPMPMNSPLGLAYADLINATRQAFHSSFPARLQVTVCVAWSPNGIDGRNFPYTLLAEVSDLLYVMDYDTQSQITQGPCIAMANAPLEGMKQGLGQFLELGIDPQKLILGVPWYGYEYTCLPTTKPGDQFCPIELVPFRGVGCSDAAGREIPYSYILREFYNQSIADKTETGGMKRENYMDAAFFNLKTNVKVKQIWFDDPLSLRHKFAYARQRGLAGVGPYTFSYLDRPSQPVESMMMWSTFDIFFHRTTTCTKTRS